MITIWSTLPHGHPSLRKRAPAAPLRARAGHPRHSPARPDLHGHPGPRPPAGRQVPGRSLRQMRKFCPSVTTGPQEFPNPALLMARRRSPDRARPGHSAKSASARAANPLGVPSQGTGLPGPLLGADVRGVHAVAGVTDMVGRVGNGRCCRVVSRGAGVVAAVSDGLADSAFRCSLLIVLAYRDPACAEQNTSLP